jgi:hypothetical protein
MTDCETIQAAGDSLPIDDFNVFLHELRTRELRRMPPGAETFLSGGCSGRWYFDWIAQNYPGIRRHLGVEAYSPMPADLPPQAEWIANTLGDMRQVPGEEVDLVFAGQTIEHLWPEDLSGFLCESYRVLRPGGWIVLDSPNRLVTRALGWAHPQHTVELTVDEIVELLELAGFENLSVRGVWLCYDRDRHRFLPLTPAAPEPQWSYRDRIAASVDRPEDCFIWWVEAAKGNARPHHAQLQHRTTEICNAVWPVTLSRFWHGVGNATGSGRNRVVTAQRDEPGCLLYGPTVPLRPGHYRADFTVRCAPEDIDRDTVVCVLEVFASEGEKIFASRPVKFAELAGHALCDISLPFVLSQAEFGIQFRVFATGRLTTSARLGVDLVGCDGENGWLAQGERPLPLRYRVADRLNRKIRAVPPIHWMMRQLLRAAG